MDCNERGMALISVLLMLTVLLAMAHVLAEKVWHTTRNTANAASREQVFWAAQAGLEAARQQLTDSYTNSDGWRSFLMTAIPQAYPAHPVWVVDVGGVEVDIYLRDNPDGDSDLQVDNDLKVYVLARARGGRGSEAMVESLCGYTSPSLASSERRGRSQHVDLAEQPVAIYGIVDRDF